MSLDLDVLAERASAVERHLARVNLKLPATSAVAHAYESIDLVRVHRAAAHGPADLRAFLAAMRDQLQA